MHIPKFGSYPPRNQREKLQQLWNELTQREKLQQLWCELTNRENPVVELPIWQLKTMLADIHIMQNTESD